LNPRRYDQAAAPPAAAADSSRAGNFVGESTHPGLELQTRARAGRRRGSRDLSLPCVVTNDAHYTSPDDATAHEVLLAVQTNATLADPGRFRFEGTGYYLKSPQEMRAVSTDEEWQAGCDATVAIAERADVKF